MAARIAPMVNVPDYGKLSDLPLREGAEVFVASSGFVYRCCRGRWLFVQRLPGGLRPSKRAGTQQQLTLSFR